METPPRAELKLLAENTELRSRLEEADETLRAIRGDQIDALVVESAGGPRIYTLQGVDAASRHFRDEILSHVSDAVIAFGDDRRVSYMNAAAEQLYHVAAPMMIGLDLSNIYQSLWPDPDGEAIAAAMLREHGEWRGETIHIRQDGSQIAVESSLTSYGATNGQAARVLAVIRDVSARKQAEAALRSSEIRYRRLFETSEDGVLLLDAKTSKITDANPFMMKLLGYSRDQLIGKEMFEIGLLKDVIASRGMFEKLKSERRIRYDSLPLKGREGGHQAVEVIANIYDEGGASVIQFNIRDITERKRAEDHNKLLIAEVNHRARNLLSVVLAVTHQTARGSDPADFVARLSERIQGLSASQDLLVESHWRGVDVTTLVEAQLAHFKDLFGVRVLFDGPPARLVPAAAQGIGMALHELATNAAKYGALSNSSGRVRISWQIATTEKPAFSMNWMEEGGPPVPALPERKGFGQMVIGPMLEAAINGVTQIHYRSSGLTWRLSAPAANALEHGDVTTSKPDDR